MAVSDASIALLQALCRTQMQVEPFIEERLREAPAGTLGALARERNDAMQALRQYAVGPGFPSMVAGFMRMLLQQAGHAPEVFDLLCLFRLQHLSEHLYLQAWWSWSVSSW